MDMDSRLVRWQSRYGRLNIGHLAVARFSSAPSSAVNSTVQWYWCESSVPEAELRPAWNSAFRNPFPFAHVAIRSDAIQSEGAALRCDAREIPGGVTRPLSVARGNGAALQD